MHFQLTTIVLVVSLLAVAHALPSTGGAPRVTLPSGDVLQGSVCPGDQVKMFRGVPYAQAPTGSLRFMPPQKLNGALSGNGKIFDASHPASPCPQFNKESIDDKPAPSEDCLTVDVYLPANNATWGNLPVKVWAYGGFNQVGGTSFPLFDACHLATDSVVVEFNYRVGPLGFLGLETAGIQGNMAIQDYLAALQWVQDNVGSFGGDKARVVLFGQSAGADDTWVVTSMPESQGLVSGAIAESGGGQFLTPYDIAQKIGKSYASELGCSGKELLCLQSKELSQLRAAYQDIPAITNGNVAAQKIAALYGVNVPRSYNMNGAILDGKIVRDEPLKVGPRVPMIAGATQDDASIITIPLLEDSGYPVTTQNYTDFLDAWGPDIGPKVGKLYPLSAFNESGSNSDAVVSAITYVVTRAAFICPSYYILRVAESVGMDAFGYRFDHTPSCPWLLEPGVGAFPPPSEAPFFGAAHTSELPYVFGNLDNMPYNNGHCNSTAAEYAMSRQLRDAWTAMADGSPGDDWPRFTSNGRAGALVQDAVSVAKLDFKDCDFWAGVWEELAGEKFL